MVRDNQKCAAVTQSQSLENAKQGQSSEGVCPESQEPEERSLDLLLSKKINSDNEETWNLPECGADAQNLPTHLRPFRSAAEYRLVKCTHIQLLHSGFYWGSMNMEEAHKLLALQPLGTFLIRDSGQTDVFFTLSYQSEEGPTSIRVQLNNLLFSLHGSHRTFASLFTLLTYYTSSSCKLTLPYRKERPERLKQMCRRALVRSHGAEGIGTLQGLSTSLKDYVQAYPHCT
ncbi:suppressor of cytokine signaling 1b [Nelusetta ayraudi]|uniref:suppressor of cytokine signaling 1b n=1 Tax=Nelusetta ayraudi TaxID=303726 RepID=UPI003F6FACAD